MRKIDFEHTAGGTSDKVMMLVNTTETPPTDRYV